MLRINSAEGRIETKVSWLNQIEIYSRPECLPLPSYRFAVVLVLSSCCPLPLRDCTLSSTDVVVCQVEIPRQGGKSGKSVNRRTEADRSQSVFCESQVEDRSIMRRGLVLQLKDEWSEEALMPVSRLGVAALYPETARMSGATRTQLSTEIKRDGGSAIDLEPYRIAVRSAPRPRQSSCWRTYWAAVWPSGRLVLPKR
jgi:hypothetical protein